MELSIRLSAVADLILPTETFADVGCDHGYLSIYLVQRNICQKVIAMDVRKGPLARAAQTIERFGCENVVETRLSDGIQKLALGEADGFVCAGMGGRLVLQILHRDKEKVACMKQVILQPQSELWLVRRMLSRWGMEIETERMVFEEGKFYPMMRIRPNAAFANAEPVCDEKFLTRFEQGDLKLYAEELYGKLLLEEKDSTLNLFLEKELKRLQQIRDGLLQNKQNDSGMARLAELEQEIKIVYFAREFYYESSC